MAVPGTSPFGLRGDRGSSTLNTTAAPQPAAASNAPQELSRRPEKVVLKIETGWRTGEFTGATPFEWQQIVRGVDGGDSTCRIMATLDAEQLGAAGTVGNEHFSQLLDRVSTDHRIRVEQTIGAGQRKIYFQGYPLPQSISWSENGQVMAATCFSEGQETLRTHVKAQVTGRMHRFEPLSAGDEGLPDPIPIPALPCVFNAGNKPNRLPGPLSFSHQGSIHKVHLFTDDDAPGAMYWTAAQALSYLVWYYITQPVEIEVSGVELLSDTQYWLERYNLAGSPLSQRLTSILPETAAAEVDVETAIRLVTSAAGVHYEIPVRADSAGRAEHWVRVYAPQDVRGTVSDSWLQSIQPVVHDIPREAPFTDHSNRTPGDILQANRAVTADFTVDNRTITRARFLGGTKTYQCTLLMRPGWLPFASLDNYAVAGQEGVTTLDTQAKRQAALDFWDNEFPAGVPLRDEDGVPTSIYHPEHPQHHTVRDVGRLWVFPDSAEYISADGTSPFTRVNWPVDYYSPYDPLKADYHVFRRADIGGGIPAAKNWVPRRRPLGDQLPLAADPEAVRPIEVWVNFAHTGDPEGALSEPGWFQLPPSHFEVLAGRAGIRITAEDLLNDRALTTDWEYIEPEIRMLEAILGLQRFFPDPPYVPVGSGDHGLGRPDLGQEWGPHFFLAVSCTVRGDERLAHTARQRRRWRFNRQSERIFDKGQERFRHDVLTSQVAAMRSPAITEADLVTREDAQALEIHAREVMDDSGAPKVAGSFQVPWIDETFIPGDSISGVSGLGIDFAAYPAVVNVQYVNDRNAGFRTIVHLSDLRDSPEIGSE